MYIYSLEGHLHQVGQDVLAVQCDPAQILVLLGEIQELGGIGHPERQGPRDVLLLLDPPITARETEIWGRVGKNS